MVLFSKGQRMPLLRQAPRLTLLLLIAPVAAGLWGTLAPALAQDGAAFHTLTAWPGFLPSLVLSVKTGMVSAAVSLGITLIIVAGLQGTAFFAALRRLLAPLLSVPHAAAALGIAFLIAPSGWIVRLVSPWLTGWQQPPDLHILNDPGGWALMLGLVAKEVPFLLLMTLAALPQTDAERRILQGQSLGVGRVMSFLIGVLPALYAQLRLPVYAVLAYSMTAVEMALILGPTLPPTLAAQTVIWMADPGLGNRSTAAAGAIALLLAVCACIGLWLGAEIAASRAMRAMAMAGFRAKALDGITSLLARGAALLLSLLMIFALAGLVLWSFAGLWAFPDAFPASLGLTTWARAAPSLAQTGLTTLAIALLSAGLALGLALACLEAEFRFQIAVAPWAMAALYLPLIVPQIAFLPGLQALALRSGFESHLYAVAASHFLFVLPYVFLSLSAPYRAWDRRIALVGYGLGASPLAVFLRLRLPMLLRPVLTALAVGLAVSIGQYLPTLLIGGGRIETVTTEAVALASGGNRRLIGAYAATQMLLPTLGFALAVAIPAFAFRNRAGMRGLE